MSRISAGLLMFRRRGQQLEVFLAHPGGPFFKKKDVGAWSIPKGEIDAGEDELAAAQREFQEETGIRAEGPFIELGEIKQSSGKIVKAWAFAGDCLGKTRSNTFTMEWPPKSGRQQEFPEVDRAEWFSLEEACKRINRGQEPFLGRLAAHLKNQPQRID